MAMNTAHDLGSILLPLIHVTSHPALGDVPHTGNARRIIFNNVLSALCLDAGAASLLEEANAQQRLFSLRLRSYAINYPF